MEPAINDRDKARVQRSGTSARRQMSRAPRVLVVEDEQDIAGLIKHALERSGDGRVEIVSSGDAALRAVTEQTPDLVILDLNLPVLSGTEVCRILQRTTGDSQRADHHADGAHGRSRSRHRSRPGRRRLRHQAVQPARARRAGPRGFPPAPAGAALGANVYAGAHLTADFDAVAIAVDGMSIRLTRREFELLKFLVENRNRVLSRDRLLERVWGYDRFIETRSVDVHVGRLRAKLGAAGQQIETVVGLGYRFVE